MLRRLTGMRTATSTVNTMKALLTTVALSAASLLAASGCATESFCFDECEGDAVDGGNTDGGGGNGGTGGQFTDSGNDGPIFNVDSGTDAGDCNNPSDEICDGVDNDCNGEIDDVDFTSPKNCGVCGNDCTAAANVVNPMCDPPSTLDGTVPGTCTSDGCAEDFYDVDGNDQNGCEYFCPFNTDGSNTTDPGGTDGCGRDDDCDGEIDEDVDTCGDVENCGECGKRCVIANGTAKCETTAQSGQQCTTMNTRCRVDQCDTGFYDVDGNAGNGCEYQCPVATPGPEVCDGLDNDCDGLIDNADPDLTTGDPDVGDSCFGGTQGLCAASSHQGVKKCVGGVVTCCDQDSNNVNATNPALPVTGLRNGVCAGNVGPFVLEPGDVQETCNNVDDDCDGTVDDSPIDEGATCGTSVGNCQVGTLQCKTGGVLECEGDVGPQPDLCNGQDDDCDGVIDGVVPAGGAAACTQDSNCSTGQVCLPRSSPTDKVCVNRTSDSWNSGSNMPISCGTNAGVCNAGTLKCTGGVLDCDGDTGPTGSTDSCGEDSNCDGSLDGQPDLQNDVANCGQCGNDCRTQGQHALWSCQNSMCVKTGCESGFIDCDGNPDCERACTPTSGTEQCNGVDDNCNCTIDETSGPGAIVPPNSAQVCGVNASATDPGCTTQVNITCTSGAWNCSFPSGYCSGSAPDYCTAQPDVCDAKDNNCNGATDEGFTLAAGYPQPLGQTCNSDDGLPPPGHGVCRQTGSYICNPGNSNETICSVTGPDTSQAGQEICDGKDNDCDALVDEYKLDNQGDSNGNFIEPPVVNRGGVYMFAYEASRPNSTMVSGGSGNGYHNAAPSGETLDETIACSARDKVPWTNLTPREVEQTCQAIGGRVCNAGDWISVCEDGQSCDYGFNTGCTGTSNYSSGPFCNLGGYDFSPGTAGDQDGLLPTRSSSLNQCAAEYGTVDAWDITGNAREMTRCQKDRALCGGPTNSSTVCAEQCCSGTSSAVESGRRMCGNYSNDRRLRGQICVNDNDCCDSDEDCDGNGDCQSGICRNTTPSTTNCRVRGVACTQNSDCCPINLPGGGTATESCISGICGGPDALPHAVYPLMGGGFSSIDEDGATCTFDFFKVSGEFKLFDTGFRCCFDQNPN